MKPLEPGDPDAVGPYTLLGRLGSGGMGEVFLGRGPEGRLAAIKVARPELADDTAFRRRFGCEVDAARRVDGRFTAAVLGADPGARRPWLATAYIAAPSLSDAVTDGGVLPPDSLRALLAGVATALDAIHRAGLTHRDLKPSNILLAEDGPRVIDFGISRSIEHSQITRTGQAPGTPGYMAPEQLRGGAVGPYTDVYALGATLVFAATGEGPFGQGDPLALLYRALEEEPRLDAVPGELRGVLAECLAKEPERRPAIPTLLAQFATLPGPGAGRWLPPHISTMVELPRQPERRLRGAESAAGAATPAAAHAATPPSTPAIGAPQGVYGPPPPGYGYPQPATGVPRYGTPPRPVPPRQGLARRSLWVLAGFGAVTLGGGGAAAGLLSLMADDTEGGTRGTSGGGPASRAPGTGASGDPTGRPAGQGSGPLPKVVSGARLGERPQLARERGAAPSELVVRTLIQGRGTQVTAGDHIKCHYILQDWKTARILDSTFARHQAALLQIGMGKVINGWDVALVKKRKGSRLEFAVPPDQAYGSKGVEGKIPPNATLLFVLDILDVIKVMDNRR